MVSCLFSFLVCYCNKYATVGKQCFPSSLRKPCICKPNYAGSKCEKCAEGYFNPPICARKCIWNIRFSQLFEELVASNSIKCWPSKSLVKFSNCLKFPKRNDTQFHLNRNCRSRRVGACNSTVFQSRRFHRPIFFLDRISQEWDSRGSDMTNHKKLIDITASLDRNFLSFTKEKGY